MAGPLSRLPAGFRNKVLAGLNWLSNYVFGVQQIRITSTPTAVKESHLQQSWLKIKQDPIDAKRPRSQNPRGLSIATSRWHSLSEAENSATQKGITA